MEIHRGEYSRKRERDHGVGYEPPLDTFPSAMNWVKQRGHTSEEKDDDDP